MTKTTGIRGATHGFPSKGFRNTRNFFPPKHRRAIAFKKANLSLFETPFKLLAQAFSWTPLLWIALVVPLDVIEPIQSQA